MRGLIKYLIFIQLCTISSLCVADIERKVEREFNVDSGRALSLDTDLGSVRVKTHARDEVLVNVYLRADTSRDNRADEIFEKFDLGFDSNGKDVEITGEHEDRRHWWNTWNERLRIMFEITVPVNYNVKIETAGGNIEIEELQGRIDIHTSGGNIALGKIRGNVDAATSGGNIKAESITGEVRVSTSGGSLQFNHIDGDLLGKTSGGSITAEFVSQIEKRVELRTSGGNIKVSVPGNLNADVQAATSGGHVSTELPMMISGKISNSSLTGRLNDGGPEMILKTSGGNIVISEN